MFIEISFTWPLTFSDIADNSNTALSSSSGELSAAGSRLSSTPSVDVVNSPIAGSAAGSSENFLSLSNLVTAIESIVCVHPWIQGIGQGDNHYRYLSPANAVQTAANKFVDSPDFARPTTLVDAAVVVVSANGFDAFAKKLSQFNTVFPVADLLLCERRARQLSTIEQDKQLLPDAAMNARWRAKGIGAIGLVRNGSGAIGELCCHAMGYELGGQSPEDELQQLISKKSAALIASASAVNDLSAIFGGGVGSGIFFSSQSPAQIKTALSNNSFSHDEPLACCLVMAGAPGSLNIVREVLGL